MEEFLTTAWNDLALDDDLDLIIENGDFKIIDAQSQAAKVLSIVPLNGFKQYPNVGFGIHQYTNAPITPRLYLKLKTELKKALEQDGHKKFDINFNNNQITITT